jgi:hypothetical protein
MSGGQRFEVAEVDGVLQLYDAQTNTIYTGASRKQVPSKPMAKEGSVQRPHIGDDPYHAKILALLQSGKAHEDGRTTVAGREAIRIVADDGAMTLLVDADTYEPIEWRVDEGARDDDAVFDVRASRGDRGNRGAAQPDRAASGRDGGHRPRALRGSNAAALPDGRREERREVELAEKTSFMTTLAMAHGS